jgi:hypothetical protein
MATLQRLLVHYGVWLGFEGRLQRVRSGKLRWLPALVGPKGTVPGQDRNGVARVEYRLDLKRIAREAQRLTADATILLDGRPAATLEGLSIAFRPAAKPAGRVPVRSPSREAGSTAKKAAALRSGAPRAG